jgi:hypothetical protein
MWNINEKEMELIIIALKTFKEERDEFIVEAGGRWPRAVEHAKETVKDVEKLLKELTK